MKLTAIIMSLLLASSAQASVNYNSSKSNTASINYNASKSNTRSAHAKSYNASHSNAVVKSKSNISNNRKRHEYKGTVSLIK